MGRLNASGSTASAAVATVLTASRMAAHCDAEDQTTEHVAGARDVEQYLQGADVAGGGAAAGGDDDIVDEARDRVGQGRQEGHGHHLGGKHQQVAGGE